MESDRLILDIGRTIYRQTTNTPTKGRNPNGGVTMTYDYLIVGAGISGAAAAYELAPHGSVALVEAESAPGYHSTGRSAALYTPNYGGATVRRINRASGAFLKNPPSGFCEYPLLSARGSLTIAAPGQENQLKEILKHARVGAAIELITADEAMELSPLLRPERVAAATYEQGVMDIDVASLHQGYLRGLRRRGGEVLCGSRVEALRRHDGYWQAMTRNEVVAGRVLVNAAGAWAGQIGDMANAASIGLIPKRRTAILVDAPLGMDVAGMPAVDYVGSDSYLKPDAGKIMASPGDQTPIEPQDAQPDEWDLAVLMDWLACETLIPVRRIAHSWAGLRSFVPDETPVIGFDATATDFFWLAGQGGYGIMMAPALGRAAADLIVSGQLPADLRQANIHESDLSPTRFI